MLSWSPLPLSVVLLLVDLSQGSASYTLVPRAVHNLHEHAVRRTHSLAQDIRVAFGGILVPRAADPAVKHVVYCKSGPPNQVILGGGGGLDNTTMTVPGGSTYTPPSAPSPSSTQSSSSSSKTSSSKGGSSTAAPSPSSPWKLVETHVGLSHSLSVSLFLIYDRIIARPELLRWMEFLPGR
jgi:hypothetical protein